MSTYSEHDVTSNGINIHYHRSTPAGGAPSIVMIHGLTDNGICWVRVADALCDSYDIILPDTRGHGFSDKPATGYTVEERAADVAGLIDALQLDRPVLFRSRRPCCSVPSTSSTRSSPAATSASGGVIPTSTSRGPRWKAAMSCPSARARS